MKKGGGPDKEWDWLDTWKGMEDVYLNNPDKVKAIGTYTFTYNLSPQPILITYT